MDYWSTKYLAIKGKLFEGENEINKNIFAVRVQQLRSILSHMHIIMTKKGKVDKRIKDKKTHTNTQKLLLSVKGLAFHISSNSASPVHTYPPAFLLTTVPVDLLTLNIARPVDVLTLTGRWPSVATTLIAR